MAESERIIPTSLCNYFPSVAIPREIESVNPKERAIKSSARHVLGLRLKNGRTWRCLIAPTRVDIVAFKSLIGRNGPLAFLPVTLPEFMDIKVSIYHPCILALPIA